VRGVSYGYAVMLEHVFKLKFESTYAKNNFFFFLENLPSFWKSALIRPCWPRRLGALPPNPCVVIHSLHY